MAKQTKLNASRMQRLKMATKAAADKKNTARYEELLKQARELWQGLEIYLTQRAGTPFCPHIKFGSSLFNRFRHKTLEPKRVHRRQYYYGARGEGENYEQLFRREGPVYKVENDDNLVVEGYYEQPYREHKLSHFLCATPDFLVTSPTNYGGLAESLVEVKHTKSRTAYEEMQTSCVVDAYWQLMCALDVFDLWHGYLVVYLVDEDGEVLDRKIRHITRECLVVSLSEIIDCELEYLVKLINFGLELRPKEDIASALRPEILRTLNELHTHPLLKEQRWARPYQRPNWKCEIGRLINQRKCKKIKKTRGRKRAHLRLTNLHKSRN